MDGKRALAGVVHNLWKTLVFVIMVLGLPMLLIFELVVVLTFFFSPCTEQERSWLNWGAVLLVPVLVVLLIYADQRTQFITRIANLFKPKE